MDNFDESKNTMLGFVHDNLIIQDIRPNLSE